MVAYLLSAGNFPPLYFRHREDLQPFYAMILATDHASLWRSTFVEKRCQYPTRHVEHSETSVIDSSLTLRMTKQW